MGLSSSKIFGYGARIMAARNKPYYLVSAVRPTMARMAQPNIRLCCWCCELLVDLRPGNPGKNRKRDRHRARFPENEGKSIVSIGTYFFASDFPGNSAVTGTKIGVDFDS